MALQATATAPASLTGLCNLNIIIAAELSLRWLFLSLDVSAITMAQTLHVFSGKFGSREEACRYSEEQWADGSDDPIWLLRQDLPVEYLSPDFIETIFGDDKLEYLESQLARDADRQKLRIEIPERADTLVLIMSAAFDGKRVRLSSTPRLQYHGEYPWKLGR
jgi:hypothetical protein